MFDVKIELRRKTKLVAGGNRADLAVEPCFSGVVGTDTVRLALFLGILHDMVAFAADCSNTFLHGLTHEIITSLQFQNLGS